MKKGLSKIALALFAAGFAFSVSAADIKVGVASDATSLDPQEQLSGQTLEMSHLVFDPLMRYTQDLQFEPRLAEKFERVDDKTVRFHLRKGVKFHSGNDFTADDVVWTVNRLKSSVDFKAIFDPISEVKKVDDYTVDLITAKPFPLVLQTVTYIFPMDSKFYTGKTEAGKDKAEIVKNGDSYASTHVSGTGPFTVKFREQGVKLDYARNANYWDKASKGNVENLTVVPIKEDATRVAALLGGDVDMIYPVAPNDLERVKNGKDSRPGHPVRYPRHHHRAEPEHQPGTERQARASGDQLRHQPGGYRREDQQGLRYPCWSAEPERLCRSQRGAGAPV